MSFRFLSFHLLFISFPLNFFGASFHVISFRLISCYCHFLFLHFVSFHFLFVHSFMPACVSDAPVLQGGCWCNCRDWRSGSMVAVASGGVVSDQVFSSMLFVGALGLWRAIPVFALKITGGPE